MLDPKLLNVCTSDVHQSFPYWDGNDERTILLKTITKYMSSLFTDYIWSNSIFANCNTLSRLYRSRCLKAYVRSKTPDEIDQIYIPWHLCDLKILNFNIFCHEVRWFVEFAFNIISRSIAKTLQFSSRFLLKLVDICRNCETFYFSFLWRYRENSAKM